MFGHRPDGKRLNKLDPVVQITPYLMPMRCDAQVFLKADLEYEGMARCIAAKSAAGERITFMNIIIAAYVRAISQNPECNRFIVNKQTFARNNCSVSFTILKNQQDNYSPETAVRIKFDPSDTIFDVRNRMAEAVEANRGEETSNAADKIARFALLIPGLATFIVAVVRLLDRYGLCPGAFLDLLPFHTSMWITNNASIGLKSVNHHIYNFGSTSMFLGMGAIQRQTVLDPDGKPKMKRYLPIGITVDERICSGAHYSKLFADMLAGIKDPSILEKEPEQVSYEYGVEYHVPKPQPKA